MGQPSAYLFRCLHWNRFLAYVDQVYPRMSMPTNPQTLGSAGSVLLFLTFGCWVLLLVCPSSVVGKEIHGDAAVGQGMAWLAAMGPRRTDMAVDRRTAAQAGPTRVPGRGGYVENSLAGISDGMRPGRPMRQEALEFARHLPKPASGNDPDARQFGIGASGVYRPYRYSAHAGIVRRSPVLAA